LWVATYQAWKDKNTGERKECVEWHRVVIFSEGLANITKGYLRKGSKMYMEGQLQTRKWTDHTGQERYTTEVVLQGFNASLVTLGGPKQENEEQEPEAENSYQAARYQQPIELDDEIPF
jgi:single-strand DNA-binding protein